MYIYFILLFAGIAFWFIRTRINVCRKYNNLKKRRGYERDRYIEME